MPGYLPNPFVFGAVKATAYSAFGLLVRTRAAKPGHVLVTPIGFGILRAIFGAIIGTPILLLVIEELKVPTDTQLVVAMILPRLLLSTVLIQKIFEPRGGWRESAVWGLLSVALASAVDLLLLLKYSDIEWLRINWC